jgi:hypothetical protein
VSLQYSKCERTPTIRCLIHIDGLSRLPPIRLISENDATCKEDIDNEPETAKPTILLAKLEANPHWIR